jgi:hypothetical protein
MQSMHQFASFFELRPCVTSAETTLCGNLQRKQA